MRRAAGYPSLRRDQRGVAAIEFAMIAPIFFGLLVGIIDVGRYMWTLNTIQYAIDQGVRAGVVQQLSDQDVTDLVKGSLAGLDAGAIEVDVVDDARVALGRGRDRLRVPVSNLHVHEWHDDQPAHRDAEVAANQFIGEV